VFLCFCVFFSFLRAVISAVGRTVLLNNCFTCHFILFTACAILCSQINDDDDDDDDDDDEVSIYE